MSQTDTILMMENITKTFGPVKALTDVNLEVGRGEIHAICGENGAGKSTLMNVLSGVYPYGSYSGRIVFDGKECRFRTINDSEADGIVIIHQELALSPFLSIAENIFMGNERARAGVVDWDRTRAEARKLLDRVGLPEDPDTRIMDIGVGKQQLVEIAKALSKDVKLLILDEPTAALNDEDSAHLLGLVRQLRDEQGVTSIIITHKLNEVAAIADNVTIIRDGSTGADGCRPHRVGYERVRTVLWLEHLRQRVRQRQEGQPAERAGRHRRRNRLRYRRSQGIRPKPVAEHP